MKIKGCLFDLDGVIVDTAKYHYIAWRELARSMGFDFTEKDNERLKGVSRMASLDILLELGGKTGVSDEEKARLAEEKNACYVLLISKMTPDEVLPGAAELLKALRAAGIGVALGSASKNAMMILNRLGLAPLFDVIIDGTKVKKAKPDPEVFVKGAEELGLKPEECCVFEDAAAGIDAAIAGGMKCVGIGSKDVLGKANLVVSGLDKVTVEMIENI